MYDAFISHAWVLPSSRHKKRPGEFKIKGRNDFISISLCLLLTSDIHQCPGPKQNLTIRPGGGAGESGVRTCGDPFPEGVKAGAKAGQSKANEMWSRIVENWTRPVPFQLSRNGVSNLFHHETGLEGAGGGASPCLKSKLSQQLKVDMNAGASERPDVTGSRKDSGDDSVFAQRGLLVLHLNIRSLIPKIHDIQQFCLENRPASISFSESWLDSVSCLVYIS